MNRENPSDLRAHVGAIRAYDEEVERWATYLEATSTSVNTTVTTARCNSRKHAGKSPEVWKVFQRDSTYMFVSKIVWRPADRINMRPWLERELLKAALDPPAAGDEQLLRFWGSLRSARTLDGLAAERMRWLSGQRDTYIRSVLTSDAAGAPELWVRCPVCGETEELQAAEVMDQVRASR